MSFPCLSSPIFSSRKFCCMDSLDDLTSSLGTPAFSTASFTCLVQSASDLTASSNVGFTPDMNAFTTVMSAGADMRAGPSILSILSMGRATRYSDIMMGDGGRCWNA